MGYCIETKQKCDGREWSCPKDLDSRGARIEGGFGPNRLCDKWRKKL